MCVGVNKPAVILLSGGLDSATVLAVARRDGFACHALSFNYGQRHGMELQAAAKVAEAGGARDHRVIDLDLGAIGGSALTDAQIPIPENSAASGIPVTYVPARNTILLAVALGYAEVLNASDIFIGVNAVDYSGYPDCRPEFVAAFEQLAKLATRAGVEGRPIRIQAPLMSLSKSGIIRLGMELGVDYSLTLSCYQPDSKGKACGVCDSCRFRCEGFIGAGIPDPTEYRA